MGYKYKFVSKVSRVEFVRVELKETTGTLWIPRDEEKPQPAFSCRISILQGRALQLTQRQFSFDYEAQCKANVQGHPLRSLPLDLSKFIIPVWKFKFHESGLQ